MNYVKRPKEEKVVLAMQQLYLKTEHKIINEINRKRALEYVDYAEVAALERVQRILNDMKSESFEYVPQMVETIFHGEGEKNAAGYENARTLTSTQTDITQMLINNLLGELTEAADTAMESATEWLSIGRLEADAFRNAALKFTAEQMAMGASWTMAQKEMGIDLVARGITAFVDKAGRKWSLTDYCTMATRTTARQASVAANLTRDDHDLWQISKIGSTCPLCAVYEGRIYSKSGTNPDYPPLAMAFGKIDPYGPDDLTNTYLNIHPNCLHSLMKYTTIGKTDEQIQKDKDFSSFEKNPATHDPRSKKQIEAYRQKENNRRKLIEDRKQWKKYQEALGGEIPSFDTFRKHKEADDDKYKEWMRSFRSFRRDAKKLDEIAPAQELIPNIPEIPEAVPEIFFEPAKSIDEAVNYAKKYVEKSFMDRTFKGEVGFKDISLENANEINRALTEVYEQFPNLDKLSGIKAISPTSSQGKKAFTDTDAVFAYDPIQNGIFINKDILKNENTFADYLKTSEDAWETVMNNIESLTGAQKELAMTYKNAGRDLVGKNVKELFEHELGHHVQWTLLDPKTNNEIGSRMKEFAPKISGYANANKSEYMAESFAAYMKGERDILDPKYVEFLDSKIKRIKRAIPKTQNVENVSNHVIIEAGKKILRNEKYDIAANKIDKFLLSPGAKHADEFFDVGYSIKDGDKLNDDIFKNYDESRKVDVRIDENGAESFSIFMNLGISKKKRFRTVWKKNAPGENPSFITAHRED